MSNLLEKASILLTPTAYDDGKILSVKPEEVLGEELVVNGNFSDGTNGWVSRANCTLAAVNNQLKTTFTGSVVRASALSAMTTTIGRKYVVSIDYITEPLSSTIIKLDIGSSYGSSNILSTPLALGASKKYYFTATSTSTYLEFSTNSGVITEFITIDNVSVKEQTDGDFDFTRNSSATRVNSQGLIEDMQTLSGNLVSNGDFSQEGSEQVTNGDFATDSDWVNSDINGFSISGGKLNLSNVAYAKITPQFNVTTVGKTYKVTFEISDYVKGSVRIFLGGAATPTQASNGVFTSYVTVSANTTIGVQTLAGDGSTLSIDNVSIKEVGQDWTIQSGTVNITDKAEFVGSGIMWQDALNINKSYKVTYEVISIVGSPNFNLYNGSWFSAPSTVGTHTVYMTNNSGVPRFYLRNASSDEITIDNVSVIEITDDTNLPRINYEGFSYQDALGSEEIVNGDFSVDSNWNKDNSWTISEGTANYNYISGRNMNSASASLVIGKSYKLVYTVLNYSSGYVINDSAETRPQRNSNGTYTEVFTARYTFFRLRGSVGGIFSIDNVSVKEVTGQEPIPDSGCGSWLFEPQSTNLLPYSEDFSQWSLGANTQLISSNNLAPSGELNAYKFKSINTVGNTYVLRQVGGLINNTTYTFSTWVRADNPSAITVGKLCALNITNGGQYAYIDVSELTTEWKRVSVTATSATSSTAQCFLATDWNVDSEIEFWGAQLEVQSYPTSYIPTNGSTVTRLQDAAFGSGNSDLINSTEGVLYADIAALSENYTGRRFITLNDATSLNGVVLRYEASGVIVARYQIGGIAQCSIAFAATITNYHKIAFKYSLNDFALWVDGVEVGVDSSGSVLSENVLNNIDFNSGNGTFPFYGETKCLAVFKEALTDEELECLTTDETSYSSFTALALANNYTII